MCLEPLNGVRINPFESLAETKLKTAQTPRVQTTVESPCGAALRENTSVARVRSDILQLLNHRGTSRPREHWPERP